MYAYQQQRRNNSRLHVVHSQGAKIINHKRKKANPVKELFRICVVFSFLAVFMTFVFPTAYNRLINNVFFPYLLYIEILNLSTDFKNIFVIR